MKTEKGGCTMSTTSLIQELLGKPIVSLTSGEIIAKVLDILIDPDALQLAAVVTSKGGGLLSREKGIDVIPSDEVQVWGQDVVLVSRPDVSVKKGELPGTEKWLSVADRLKGQDVISTDGLRVGKLNDVVIDTSGQLVGYDLARAFVFSGGPSGGVKQIAAEATSSLGQDVLIVDATQIISTQVKDTSQSEEIVESVEDMTQVEGTRQTMQATPHLEEPAQAVEGTDWTEE
jgi:uncharacterized protein YrrD